MHFFEGENYNNYDGFHLDANAKWYYESYEYDLHAYNNPITSTIYWDSNANAIVAQLSPVDLVAKIQLDFNDGKPVSAHIRRDDIAFCPQGINEDDIIFRAVELEREVTILNDQFVTTGCSANCKLIYKDKTANHKEENKVVLLKEVEYSNLIGLDVWKNENRFLERLEKRIWHLEHPAISEDEMSIIMRL